MRSFFFSAALLSVVVKSEEGQKRGASVGGPYVWDLVQTTTPVLKMGAKAPSAEFVTAERLSLRNPANCIFPLDVMILQDATNSFADNIDSMKNTQLDLIYNGITSKHPNSKFGIVSFKDKPINPLGNRDDYCSRFDAPLGSDLQKLKTAYSNIVAYGGADAPENQLGTLYNVLGNAAANWSDESLATKLVIVSTDAGPHFGGDYQTGVLPAFNPLNNQDEIMDICLAQYYPSLEQVKAKVLASNAYVASLVYDGDWANGWPSKSWMSFNDYIMQPADFVAAQAPDSSDFWEKLATIIGVIEDIECQKQTTTPAPTTVTSTTVTTTVTSTEPTTTSSTTTTPMTTTTQAPTTTTAAPTTVTTTTPATTATTLTTAVPYPTTTVELTTAVVTTAGTTEITTTRPVTQPTVLTRTTKPEEPCSCPCENCTCCPEVVIKLQSKPLELHLDVIN